MDAVVAAITFMEDSGVFNAGLGGVLQLDGVQRLDASLMEGRDLSAGAVAGLEGVRNPIQAARMIMDSPHVLMTNVGASRLARGLARLPKPSREAKERLKRLRHQEVGAAEVYKKYFSTVGAVALDSGGDMAAGTSTGGIYAMLPGRIGDSPVIGAGTYAENSTGAVSCTGSGEHILRRALAKETCMLMAGAAPASAGRRALEAILHIDGQAGLIALDRNGCFAIMHTTRYMANGVAKDEKICVRAEMDYVQ